MSPALSYIHPAVIAAGLALALAALRLGLYLRDFRVRRKLPPPRSLRRHTLISQPAAVVLVAGFVLGPLSAVVVRGWRPFATFHAWAGLVAIACFVAASLLGLRLKDKRSRRANLHGILGVLGVLAGALAAVTGIELLP